MSGAGDELAAQVASLRALRSAGAHDEHLAKATELAAAAPSCADARLEAAFALDRQGDEALAVRHYDAAWALGVPDELRRRFLVGYASTLRNVGRADEAIVLLTSELERDPDYPPFTAFLALALHSAGHGAAALATMLGCVLGLAERAGAANPLDGYQRALDEYYRELLLGSAPRPQ